MSDPFDLRKCGSVALIVWYVPSCAACESDDEMGWQFTTHSIDLDYGAECIL